MDARQLTELQGLHLMTGAADRRDWYKRLRERMDAVGWDKNCPLYLATIAAQEAAQVCSAIWEARPPVATIFGPRKSDAGRLAPPK